MVEAWQGRSVAIVALLVTIALSGCIGTSGAPVCETYPYSTKEEVYEYVKDPWTAQIERDPDTGKRNSSILGVIATRESYPDHPDSENGTVVCKDFNVDSRPDFIQDLLCLAEWRIDNIETLTDGQFWTMIGTSHKITDDAVWALKEEQIRQDGFESEYCCYILFKGDYYGVGHLEGSHTV